MEPSITAELGYSCSKLCLCAHVIPVSADHYEALLKWGAKRNGQQGEPCD